MQRTSGPSPIRLLLAVVFFLTILLAFVLFGVRGKLVVENYLEQVSADAKDSQVVSDLNFERIGEDSTGLISSRYGFDQESSKHKYTLELLVVDSRVKAIAAIERYAGIGVDAYFTPVKVGDKKLFKVRYGLFPKRGLANDMGKNLAETKGLKPVTIELR